MKKTIAILLVALMALAMFAACANKSDKGGDSKETDPLVGTWEVDFEAMLSELGEEERAIFEAMGITADQYQASYTFNADGTGKVSMNMMGESEEADFTYTAKDGKIEMTATVDGETSTMEYDYEVNGDKLVLTAQGESMTFNRK